MANNAPDSPRSNLIEEPLIPRECIPVPHKRPLLAMGLLNLFLCSVAIGFLIRVGFDDALEAQSLAIAGSTIQLVLNVTYSFLTLKLMFALMSRSFPTWAEVQDFRKTIICMFTCCMLGVPAFLASFSLYTDYGYVHKPRSVLTGSMNFSSPAYRAARSIGNHTHQEANDSAIIEQIEDIVLSGKFLDNETGNFSNFSANILGNDVMEEEQSSTQSSRAYNDKYDNKMERNHPIAAVFGASFTVCLVLAIAVVGWVFEARTTRHLTMLVRKEMAQNPEPHIQNWLKRNILGTRPPSSDLYWEVASNRTHLNPPPQRGYPAPYGVDTVCTSRAAAVAEAEAEGVTIREKSEGSGGITSRHSDQSELAAPSLPQRNADQVPHTCCCNNSMYAGLHRGQRSVSGAIPKTHSYRTSSGSKANSELLIPEENENLTNGEINKAFTNGDSGQVSSTPVPPGTSVKIAHGSSENSTEMRGSDNDHTDLLLQAASRDLANIVLHTVETVPEEPEEIEMSPK